MSSRTGSTSRPSARSPSSSVTRCPLDTVAEVAASPKRSARPCTVPRSAAERVFPATPPVVDGHAGAGGGRDERHAVRLQRVLLVGERDSWSTRTHRARAARTTELLHLAPDAYELGRALLVRWAPRQPKAASRRSCRSVVPSSTNQSARARDRGTATGRSRVQISNSKRPPWQATAARRSTRWPPRTAGPPRCRGLADHRRSHHDRRLRPRLPSRTRARAVLLQPGGGLGWGMPTALVYRWRTACTGAAAVSDGSAMYSPQALWTAAHERLPVVFAVVNNANTASSRTTCEGWAATACDRTLRRHGHRRPSHRLRLIGGVDGGHSHARSRRPATSATAVRRTLEQGGPHLLELPIAAAFQGTVRAAVTSRHAHSSLRGRAASSKCELGGIARDGPGHSPTTSSCHSPGTSPSW